MDHQIIAIVSGVLLILSFWRISSSYFQNSIFEGIFPMINSRADDLTSTTGSTDVPPDVSLDPNVMPMTHAHGLLRRVLDLMAIIFSGFLCFCLGSWLVRQMYPNPLRSESRSVLMVDKSTGTTDYDYHDFDLEEDEEMNNDNNNNNDEPDLFPGHHHVERFESTIRLIISRKSSPEKVQEAQQNLMNSFEKSQGPYPYISFYYLEVKWGGFDLDVDRIQD